MLIYRSDFHPRQPAVTVDIDSTLADTRHRAATMIDQRDRDNTDWLAYAQACGGDTPTDVVALVRALVPYYAVVLVTSRPLGARPETEQWLTDHEVPYDALVMATIGEQDRYPDPTEFKVAAIEHVRQTYSVLLHIDDWWETGVAIRDRLGIPTVIVRVYAPDVAMVR